MKKTLMVVLLLAAMAVSTGCVTKLDKFVTSPKEFVGVGIDNGWMWVDASEFGEELAKNGVNITSIEVGGGSSTKDTYPNPKLVSDPNRGYWAEPSRWNEMKGYLDEFLDQMKKRRITVKCTLSGWGFRGGVIDPSTGKPSTACSARFDEAWYANMVDYFVKRGTEGIVICPVAEPYCGKNMECVGKSDRFVAILDSKWGGMKAWNKGARPKTAPAGYFIEYHAANQNDFPPAGISYVLTDSPVGGTIYMGTPAETAVINPPAAKAYAQKVRARGVGFISYGYPYTSWKIDKAGIKAIGEAGK